MGSVDVAGAASRRDWFQWIRGADARKALEKGWWLGSELATAQDLNGVIVLKLASSGVSSARAIVRVLRGNEESAVRDVAPVKMKRKVLAEHRADFVVSDLKRKRPRVTLSERFGEGGDD
jgi:hypothetical protein